MRTKSQSVKRYFAAVWTVYLLSMIAACVVVPIAAKTVPLGVIMGLVAVFGVCGPAIGFVHGVTALHVKQLDEQELAEASGEEN